MDESRTTCGTPAFFTALVTASTGTRFETLATELGDGFIRVELEGKGHATLTAHRQQVAVDRVLAFFDERLRPGGSSA